MKKRFNKLTFSNQIKNFYVLIFLLIFVLCGGLYVVTSLQFVSNSEDDSLEYGLQAVERNMDALLENINDYSKVVAFDDDVQRVLSMENSASLSYEDTIALQNVVTHVASCCDGVSSIYLFDNEGESYIAGNIYEIEIIRANLEGMMLYRDAARKKLSEDVSSIIFSFQSEENEDQQVISYVRLIRNLDTMETIGMLTMNVSNNRLLETFSSVAGQVGMELAILDNEGKIIAASANGTWLESYAAEEGIEAGREFYQSINEDGHTYKIGKMKTENEAWSIVGVIPRMQTLSGIQQYMWLSVVIIVIGMLLCVFGASVITHRISVPLKNILYSMEQVKGGTLERVPLLETNQEIDSLQMHYNQMLGELEHLMNQKVEEQRLRRKYELSLLQEQIKPHFLYNTFDSVCALAMMGETDAVYTMMQALGQYYRSSLNKGREIITIKEELSIVQNYLIIQSYRYDDVFEAVYDVDESILQNTMIKLILQPFVENAIYHGFREHNLQGTIIVRAKDYGNYVKLQVEDDGMGMTEEKLSELMQKTDVNQGKRFGLYGTMQRIRLYYQYEERNLVEIQSEVGEGTVITVWIPKEKGEEDAESISD